MLANIIFYLHEILPPIPQKTAINADTKKRYTVSESRDSFVKFHPTDAALALFLTANETTEPMVNFIGDYDKFQKVIVNIDSIRYEFFSLAKALDLCYKLYFVLNVPYAKPCELLWAFIDKHFYGTLDTSPRISRTTSSSLSNLIARLDSGICITNNECNIFRFKFCLYSASISYIYMYSYSWCVDTTSSRSQQQRWQQRKCRFIIITRAGKSITIRSFTWITRILIVVAKYCNNTSSYIMNKKNLACVMCMFTRTEKEGLLLRNMSSHTRNEFYVHWMYM